jgi:hypothetical protein
LCDLRPTFPVSLHRRVAPSGRGEQRRGSSHSHDVGTLAASAPSFVGSATSVVQPYLVVYIWKRTA